MGIILLNLKVSFINKRPGKNFEEEKTARGLCRPYMTVGVKGGAQLAARGKTFWVTVQIFVSEFFLG